jgi:hypothetical protein
MNCFMTINSKHIFATSSVVAALFLAGCQSIPPGAERGPHGTMAYDVLVDASQPGALIRVNGQDIGNAPLHLKIFGDPDGTFHDFGSFNYVVEALPITTNQFPQVRTFQTGHLMTPEDLIPRQIHFDMNQQAPPQAYGPSGYPPAYYGPGPYPYPYYYSPGVRVYVGPGYRRYRHW